MPVRENPWDVLRAELGDVQQAERLRRKRPCAGGCGRDTQATSGYCMDCQPTLLDEPQPSLQPGEPRMLEADEEWPEWLL